MLGRVITALTVAVAITSAASAQGDRGDIVGQIHEQITKVSTRYKGERKTKALAGCINWEASTPQNVIVRHRYYYHTGEGSDRDFLPSQLMRSAVNRCNILRKKHGSTCKCVPIDKNGRSALKVPDAFIEKARAWFTPPKPQAPSAAVPAVGVYPTPRSPGETFRDCADCPEMIVIPAGGFSMGSPESETTREGVPKKYANWERPQHRVTIPRALALGKHEVTRAEFAAFVQDTGHDAQGCWYWGERKAKKGDSMNWRDPNFSQSDRDPVVCVNWDDAKAYLRWMSRKTGQKYRLPSEAEWEYAARAGTTTARFWGEDADRACDYGNVHDRTSKSENDIPWAHHDCRDGYAQTAPVGSFPANEFGLHDVIGNVWEWIEDCWNDSYSGAPSDGRAWTSGECSRRVRRGGSWINDPWVVRDAHRNWASTWERFTYMGFRVAKTLP